MAHKNTKKIVECLNNFDFHKVHKVMKNLNWKWGFGDAPCHVPSKRELKEKASELLFQCLECSKSHKKDYRMSTGGFEVNCYYNNGEIDFELNFVLTYWETF